MLIIMVTLYLTLLYHHLNSNEISYVFYRISSFIILFFSFFGDILFLFIFIPHEDGCLIQSKCGFFFAGVTLRHVGEWIPSIPGGNSIFITIFFFPSLSALTAPTERQYKPLTSPDATCENQDRNTRELRQSKVRWWSTGTAVMKQQSTTVFIHRSR